MAKSDATFPFLLTFCRPWHAAAAREGGARQLFAVIGDGVQKCSITEWPQPGLPFLLHARRALTIRIFVAEDRPSFEQGQAEELGTCYLPLWRVPEVLPPPSQEPPKLWLALEVPQGRKRMGASTAPGGAAASCEPKEDSEILEKFERSRDLAISSPQAPRICVLVQSVQEAAAPGTPGRVASPLRSGGSAPLRTQLAGGARAGDQTSSPSARPESNSEIWRVKFEEERHRYEEQLRQCQRDLRLARAAVEPVSRKLEGLSCFTSSRLERCWAGATFDSWCTWLAGEKGKRQFEQVAEELEGLGEERRAAAARLSKSRAEVEARFRELDAKRERRNQRWAALLAGESLLSERSAKVQVMEGCLAAWRSWASLAVATRAIVDGRPQMLVMQQLALVVIVWSALVGLRALEESRCVLESTKEQLPARARCAAAVRAAIAAAWMGPSSEEALVETLLAWARTARRRALRRRSAAAILDSAPWRGLDALFLECCLILWRGVIGDAEAAVAAERTAGAEFVRLYQRRAEGLVEASREACQVGGAIAVLMCWHFFAAQCRLQRALENAFARHQDIKANCVQWRDELDSLRASHANERARWQGDQDCLLEELRQVQRLVEEETSASEAIAEGRRSLELQEAAALQRSRTLADELADMRLQTAKAREQLLLAKEDTEAALFLAHDRRVSCEEECLAALSDLQPLQLEAARLLEKRQADLRTARQQARGQVGRQEASARRVITMHEEEQEAWVQRMEQSEARVGKLEEEVQQMQQSRRAARDQDDDRAELLSEVAAVEQRLEAFEDGERVRRQELTDLRGSHAELQAQHAALERRRGLSSRGA